MRFLLLAPLSLLACSSAVSSSPGSDAGDAATGPTPSESGPSFVFHVRATAAPFAHSDGFSGQTSSNTKQGIRALRIYRDASDSSPIVVFDHGKGFVEAGYDDGDDTVVGSAKIASIPAGRYTRARIVISHSIFRVNSTLHVAGSPYPGTFDCTQTLSDHVTLEGVEHATKGWYRYVFTTAGMSYPQEGTNAPLPTTPGTGGFVLQSDGTESWYEMPMDVVRHSITD